MIGYVSTRYAKLPAEEIQENVDHWVRLYPGVLGDFYDEQASAGLTGWPQRRPVRARA